MAAVNLYPHQLKALQEMKNGCILAGGVGTGKSITSIAYFFTKVCGGELRINSFGDLTPLKKPRDLYIITTARKRDGLDWQEEALPFGLSTKMELSHSGAQVFVDSWNNIPKYKDVENAFFIFDEQRLVGSGAWVKAFLKIAKNNEWIMLSATPGDNWMDYIPVFVANGFYKNRTEFLRKHVVYNNFSKYPKVDHYVENGILQKMLRQILVDMPYERHTVRHVKNVLVKYDEVQFKRVVKDRWHIYEDRPIKDVGEYFRVMRKLVNSDPSRIDAVQKLMEKHERLIVFYNFNYELEALRELAVLHPNVDVAEWNGQKHEEVPTSDRWVYLVQYAAGSEAWNCVSTNATVFYSLNYSYKVNHQAKGRTDRLDTKYVDQYYYILRSTSAIDNMINKSITLKRDFNEKAFLKESGFEFALAA
jgi:hypothetical protein